MAKNTPIADPVADARKLKRNATATADELRAFLRELRGKSPKEMLGEVANSNLFQASVTAATGTAILILFFTIVPFVWSKITGSDTPEVATPNAVATETQPATPATPETPATTTPDPSAADALGVGQERTAPANVNPLENTNDDLLKDLE